MPSCAFPIQFSCLLIYYFQQSPITINTSHLRSRHIQSPSIYSTIIQLFIRSLVHSAFTPLHIGTSSVNNTSQKHSSIHPLISSFGIQDVAHWLILNSATHHSNIICQFNQGSHLAVHLVFQ